MSYVEVFLKLLRSKEIVLHVHQPIDGISVLGLIWIMHEWLRGIQLWESAVWR